MEQIEVAKGISEFGMLAVTAAFFLILSGTMLVVFVKWFVRLINGIIGEQKETQAELLKETRSQNEKLDDIREGLIEETMTRIKVVSGLAYDLAVEEVYRLVVKIRQENNIADEGATVAKIKRLLLNLHERRNTRFDNFRYRGKRLSGFTNVKWVDEVAEVVKREVYEDENVSRSYTNITAVYDNIKIEFYHNLKLL